MGGISWLAVFAASAIGLFIGKVVWQGKHAPTRPSIAALSRPEPPGPDPRIRSLKELIAAEKIKLGEASDESGAEPITVQIRTLLENVSENGRQEGALALARGLAEHLRPLTKFRSSEGPLGSAIDQAFNDLHNSVGLVCDTDEPDKFSPELLEHFVVRGNIDMGDEIVVLDSPWKLRNRVALKGTLKKR